MYSERDKILQLSRTCELFMIKNSEYLFRAKKEKRKEREKIYLMNEAELNGIKDKIELLKKMIENSNCTMLLNLQFFNYWFMLHSQLLSANPDDYNFPLRYFTSSFSAKTYLVARTLWENGATNNELILAFNKIVKKRSFYKTLFSYLDYIEKEHITCNRKCFIYEISKAFTSKLFLATTLVTITQTEGILWDFAAFVNSDDLKIYYTLDNKIYPFLYNAEKQVYTKSRDRLLSIRGLLLKTRLGEIIPFGLYSYLISEFYDDRNPLTHGEIKNRNLKVDTVAALLCLYAVLHFLKSYKLSKNEFLNVFA